MFGVNWSDPTTLWLNLTNLGLGLLVLGCAIPIFGALGAIRARCGSQEDAPLRA